jgi:hypothetical protein
MTTFTARATALVAGTAALLASLSASAQLPSSQNLSAMINREMSTMNQRLAANQQRINGFVQQRMRDPRVRAGYSQYVARARSAGVQPTSFANYAYGDVATNGYSRQGVALFRANEANNAARIASSAAGLRAAQAARGAAQLGMQQSFSNNQREFGNLLRGTSTYVAGNGATQVLPHTWQSNTYQSYQGREYYVDYSGGYHVLANNGYWYPLAPR